MTAPRETPFDPKGGNGGSLGCGTHPRWRSSYHRAPRGRPEERVGFAPMPATSPYGLDLLPSSPHLRPPQWRVAPWTPGAPDGAPAAATATPRRFPWPPAGHSGNPRARSRTPGNHPGSPDARPGTPFAGRGSRRSSGERLSDCRKGAHRYNKKPARGFPRAGRFRFGVACCRIRQDQRIRQLPPPAARWPTCGSSRSAARSGARSPWPGRAGCPRHRPDRRGRHWR